MTVRATYDVTIRPGVICLVDKDGRRSIANDADNVIADLAGQEHDLVNNLVIYRDTRGVWDQLLVADGNRFAGFSSINERDLDAAIAKLQRMQSRYGEPQIDNRSPVPLTEKIRPYVEAIEAAAAAGDDDQTLSPQPLPT